MKRTLTALATVTALSLGIAAPASSMEMEFNMLTGAVYNSLRSMGLDTSNIGELSLNEIAQIQLIAHGGDGEGEKTRLINAILERHE